MADDTGAAADEETRPGTACDGIKLSGRILHVGLDDDATIRLDNMILAGRDVMAGRMIPADQGRINTGDMGNNVPDVGLMGIQEFAQFVDDANLGISGVLDTSPFYKHLQTAGVTTFQGLAEYLDQKITGIDTPAPTIDCATQVTETTALEIRITNWEDGVRYRFYVDIGEVIDKGNGTYDWEVPNIPGAEEDHLVKVYARGLGRDESDAALVTVTVKPLLTGGDEDILFEGATMTDVEFPDLVNVGLENNELKALLANVEAESIAVLQDDAGYKFANARAHVTSRTTEFTIRDSDTTNVDLGGIRLSDGDLVLLGSGGTLIEYDTTGMVTIVGGGSTDAPGSGMNMVTAAHPTKNESLGKSMAKNSNRIVVGAHYYEEDPNVCKRPGCVYVYKLDGTAEFRIQASVPQESMMFGFAVAMSETKIYVGASRYSTDELATCGAVYIYDMDGGNEFILKPSDIEAKQNFGMHIMVSATTLFVSSYKKKVGSVDKEGCVYMYDLDGSNERKLLAPSGDRAADRRFGWRMACNDNYVVISAPYDASEEGGRKGGVAYVCDMDGVVLTTLRPPVTGQDTYFGMALAITDTHVLVGGYKFHNEDVTGVRQAGAAFLYNIDGTGEMIIYPTEPVASGGFSKAVALGGSKIMVSQKSKDLGGKDNVGIIYTYDIDGSNVSSIGLEDHMYTRNADLGSVLLLDPDMLYFNQPNFSYEDNDGNSLGYAGAWLSCASGAGPIDCTLEVLSLGLSDAPTTVIREIAKLETSIVKAGRDAVYESRTAVSHSYSSGLVTAHYDMDGRGGEEFRAKVKMPLLGSVVTKIEVIIDKAR